MYKHILNTTKRPEKLDGIIRVALYDEEIQLEDFTELLYEKNEIIMKEGGVSTMKKEIYDEIITLARENELAGILRVAVLDPDIMPSDFSKLAARVDTIKEKCEEIGK